MRSGSSRELHRGLLDGRDRADGDVLAVEELEPGSERLRRDSLSEGVADLLLGVRVEMPVGQLRQLEQFAQAREEVAFQRSDREVAPVGRRVDAVAGQPTGQQPGDRLAAESVRDEPVPAQPR